MGAQPYRWDETRAGRVIGVVSPLIGGFYFGSVVAGVTRAAARAGMRVVAVQTFAGRLAREKHHSSALPGDRGGLGVMDGIVVITEALDPDRLEQLVAGERPVVLVGTDDAPGGVPVLRPDNAGGTRAAVEHLLRHGHTRIGFAGDLVQGDVRERFDAYRATLLAHDIEPEDAWFLHTEGNSAQGGADAAEALAAAGRPVTATVAATDLAAIGLMRGLQAAGATLPRDHAVIGFDRTMGGVRHVPRLSTIDPHHDLVGELAVEHLLTRLRGGERPEPPTRVAATLVVRESCGCDRVTTWNVATTGSPVAASAAASAAGARTFADDDADDEPDEDADDEDTDDVTGDAGDAEDAEDADTTPPSPAAVVPARVQLARVADGGFAGAVRVRSRRGDTRSAGLDRREVWHDAVLVALDAAAARGVAPSPAAMRRLQDLTTTLGPYPETLEQCVTAVRQLELELGAEIVDDTRRTAVQRAATDVLLALTRGCLRPQLLREATLERALADQYEVDMDLVPFRGVDPRSLTWLPGGGRTSACLGLWTGAETSAGERELEVVGAQARSGALARTVGRRLPADQFPPSALLRGEQPDGHTLVIVVPVASGTRDWGLLAIAGRTDPRGTYSRDRHQHWAALVAAALEREEELTHLRGQVTAFERAAVDAGAITDALRQQQQQRELWLRALGHGLWDWDITEGSVEWSKQWATLVGVAHEELTDQPSEWLDRVHPDDRIAVSSLVAAQLGGAAGPMRVEHRMHHASGTYRWMLAEVFTVPNASGAPARMIGALVDVTERKEHELALARGVLRDPETRLPNRAAFLDRLSGAVDLARRGDADASLALVCRAPTDRSGGAEPEPGPEADVVAATALLLDDGAGHGDIVGRVGDDCLACVLLDRPGRRGVERLDALLDLLPVEHRRLLSVGVVEGLRSYGDAAEAMRAAEVAALRDRPDATRR